MRKITIALFFIFISSIANSEPLRFFGLTMGHKLSLPECLSPNESAKGLSIAKQLADVQQMCIRRIRPNTVNNIKAEYIVIAFPQNSTPQFSPINIATASLDENGVLVQLSFSTDGDAVQGRYLEMLRDKLGSPDESRYMHNSSFAPLAMFSVWYFPDKSSVIYAGEKLSTGMGTLLITSGMTYRESEPTPYGTPM